ncbi:MULTISPECIES: hypothetical protein [Ralstonia]|jgi:hypothetical protein|uniref:Uncharacterized protein n=1 Tax=Ralstonia mannitolilytica TaxID=105219 RepID=A0AAD2B146_9RALS|nr:MULTISPECIES: hypothetical protein [Ralstonia]MBY4721270.1 hypothetical protein [Ralstonia mannitolilytica]PLT16333.1 hypothetical protein CXP34_19495 [Ralstonia mannitolilytica]QIF08809.1 hypothetical protein G5A69_15020 [Ralstonia mannitolilytica]CAJ0692222.1 hypothetical protein R77591_03882 [Ralstonia mannitolilytica]CAJ0739109.1 hypothetical protein R76696_02292 [Ralstonia mannitolilytica]
MQLKNLSDEVALLLPDDLLWSDEHAWTPAVASASYLITGALLIQSATRQAGRPITLVGAPDMAWVTRVTVEQLRAWAAIPVGNNTGRFALTFADGRSFSVAFRHAETAIEAEPVLGIPARADTDFYRLTLRFLEI